MLQGAAQHVGACTTASIGLEIPRLAFAPRPVPMSTEFPQPLHEADQVRLPCAPALRALPGDRQLGLEGKGHHVSTNCKPAGRICDEVWWACGYCASFWRVVDARAASSGAGLPLARSRFGARTSLRLSALLLALLHRRSPQSVRSIGSGSHRQNP